MPRLSRPSWVHWLNPSRPKACVKCPSPVGRFTRHKSRPLLEAPWSAISQLRTELLDADRLSVAAGLVWNRACNIFQGILWPGLCVSESGSEEILPEPSRPARLLIRRRPAQQVAHFLLNRWMIMNGITWWSRVLTVVGVAWLDWPGRRHPRVDRHPKTSCASETMAAITWASWSQAVDALIMSESRTRTVCMGWDLRRMLSR